MNRLLDQDIIIHYLSSLNKTSLIIWNNGRKNSFQPVGNHFCYQFVAYVAKGDGVESREGVGSFYLRDKGQESRIGATP